MFRITEVIKHLLIINVLMFFGSIILEQSNIIDRSFFSLYFPASEHFKPYQLLTHMFMHGDMNHLIFNMLSLFFIGPYVEQFLRPKKFLTYYFIAGFGAMFMHFAIEYVQYISVIDQIGANEFNVVQNEGRDLIRRGMNYTDGRLQTLNAVLNIPVLGASGAIYGVLTAFAVLFPNTKLMLLFIPYPIKAKYLVAGFIAIDLIFGVSGRSTGIAHFAHIGGAIFGFLLLRYWQKTGQV
jgi:membrane associated rhomboid family serine protease